MRGRGRHRPALPPSSSPRRPPPAAFVAGGRPGGWREWSAEPKPSGVGQPAPDHGKRPTLVAPKSTDDDVGGSSSSPVVGTCPDMCPATERAQRERLGDLSVFERLGGDPGKTSPNLAVKKFCRSISTTCGQESDVRPPHVLLDTLKYLMKLLDTSEYPFHIVHDFVFDRTRSIRQDLTMQNIVSDQVVFMYEEMVKFHINSLHKLVSCKNDSDELSRQYLNMEQLTKTLMSLYSLYAVGHFSSKNEAEFYSFYILLNLCPHSRLMDKSFSLWLRKLSPKVIKSEQVSFARNVLRCFRIGNYRRFLHIVTTGASFLQSCLLGPLITEVRIQALMYINHCGYKLQPYPLNRISEILMMEETELEPLCRACGLVITVNEVGTKVLPTKQTNFNLPSRGGLSDYGSAAAE